MKTDLNNLRSSDRQFRDDINAKVALLLQSQEMNRKDLNMVLNMTVDDISSLNDLRLDVDKNKADARLELASHLDLFTENTQKQIIDTQKQIRDTQKQISALAQLYAIQIASSQYNQPVNQYNDLLLSRLNLMNFTTTEVAQVVSTYQGTYVSGKYVPPAPLYWVVDNGNLILNEIPDCIVCLISMRDTLILPCKHLACCQSCFPRLNDCPICRGAIIEHKVLDWVEELTNVPSGNVTPYYMSGIFKDTRTQFERLCI